VQDSETVSGTRQNVSVAFDLHDLGHYARSMVGPCGISFDTGFDLGASAKACSGGKAHYSDKFFHVRFSLRVYYVVRFRESSPDMRYDNR
jgi:hypothetical protein